MKPQLSSSPPLWAQGVFIDLRSDQTRPFSVMTLFWDTVNLGDQLPLSGTYQSIRYSQTTLNFQGKALGSAAFPLNGSLAPK